MGWGKFIGTAGLFGAYGEITLSGLIVLNIKIRHPKIGCLICVYKLHTLYYILRKDVVFCNFKTNLKQ